MQQELLNEEVFADNESGFIVLQRKMLSWGWYSDINCTRLFIHLLLNANFKEKVWRGIKIGRGQFLTSLETLAKDTSLTVMQIRTSLSKLKVTNEVTSATTSRYTLITITNYDKYQTNNKRVNNKITNKQQTNNKQITTTNNDNKENNDNNISLFNSFYENYPRKESKVTAQKAYLKILSAGVKHEDILLGLLNYQEHIVAKCVEKRFIPYPASWLNQERWKEDFDKTPLKINSNGYPRPLQTIKVGSDAPDASSPDFFKNSYGLK